VAVVLVAAILIVVHSAQVHVRAHVNNASVCLTRRQTIAAHSTASVLTTYQFSLMMPCTSSSLAKFMSANTSIVSENLSQPACIDHSSIQPVSIDMNTAIV
jgi:hypothetical protein